MPAAEILNDRVVPFYDEHGIRLSRMLTDRQPALRARLHDCHLQSAFRRVDRRVRVREVTGVLLDRLTHHVHILEMNGDSYRLKQSKQRQRRM